MEQNSATNRNPLIDIEKSLAIFCVVWAHLLTPDNGGVHVLLGMCHMPVFFCISGFFFWGELRKYSFSEFLKRKTLRLFVPYLIWSAISLCFNVILSGNISTRRILLECLEIFLYARSVWFFIALFLLLVIMRCACEINRILKIPYVIGMLVIFAAFFFIRHDDFLCLYKLKEFTLFFILGYVVRGLKENGHLHFQRYGFLVLLLPVHVAYGYFAFSLEVPDGRFPYPVLAVNPLWLIGCALGALSLIGISALLCRFPQTKRFAAFGTYSMDIYVCHMFFIKLYKLIIPELPFGFLRGGVLCIVSILISIAIISLSRFILRKTRIYRFSIGER